MHLFNHHRVSGQRLRENKRPAEGRQQRTNNQEAASEAS